MGKKLTLVAIRLLLSAILLYGAIFLKFAGVPGALAVFTQMSHAFHGLISQPVFRLGSGAFETVVAVLLFISEETKRGGGLSTGVESLGGVRHLCLLGCEWIFCGALV